jgi:hypothetical protein
MNKCFECGEPAQANHHVVPKILGGTKTIPLCLECHGKVHDKNLTSMKKLSIDTVKLWGPIRAGRRMAGGAVPYGFDLIKTHGYRGGTLVENEDEQKLIKIIIGWKNDGCTYQWIVNRLNEEKIPSKTGKGPWCMTSLFRICKRVFDNPSIYGIDE